jgi:hypothetical protein
MRKCPKCGHRGYEYTCPKCHQYPTREEEPETSSSDDFLSPFAPALPFTPFDGGGSVGGGSDSGGFGGFGGGDFGGGGAGDSF